MTKSNRENICASPELDIVRKNNFQKNLEMQWELPKGDLYLIRRNKNNGLFYSMIQRENEMTICCHGTKSMNIIRQYFLEVKQSQIDTMNGMGVDEPTLKFWKEYRQRMIQKRNVSHSLK